MNNYECDDNQCVCKIIKGINFYFQHQPKRQGNFNVDDNHEETKEDDDEENGVSLEKIQIVMNLTKCNKKEAIKALKQCNGDPVTAIKLFVK